jgi:protease-4
MKNNTYSLLNSHWMITSSGASSMMPQLLSLIKGNEIKEVASKLPVVFMEMDGEDFTDVPEINSASQYINVLSIKTPLFKYDQMCGPAGTRSMTRLLKEWEANDNVVGVVLDIDCPGGQVSGLAEFAEYLHNYSKPIVAYTDGVMASAAYYVAAACDHIVVNPNADLIGSIGTMLTYVNLDGILEAEGGIIKDIYATGSSRKNEEHRAMKEGSDALLIKNILDPARDKFVDDVNLYHPGIDSSVFEGAIYAPGESLSLGLVDELGTIQKAFDKVVMLSNASKISNNKNTNMNTKQLPNVQAVLGLDAPLASTEENGSYLNFEQLDTLENRLAELEASNTSNDIELQSALAQTNEDLANAQTQLTATQETVVGIETSIDAMMTSAGLTVEGTLAEKTIALNAKVLEMGSKDGASHTNTIIDVENTTKGNVIGGIDVTAALNN